MIVREWSATADADGLAAYRTHLLETVYPVLEQTAGFAGFMLLSGDPDEHGVMRVVVQTRWTSMDAVRGFAGDDPTKAVVEPAARDVLRSFSDTVQHLEVRADHTSIGALGSAE